MADIVNLRAVRKRAKRAKQEADARASRAAHGRPAADRKRDKKRSQQAGHVLDQHRIARGDDS